MNLKKEKIKQTEITKFSKLPWPIINLREICKPEYGYTTSAKNFGKYRFVRITDIDDNGLLKLENKKYILPNQDIQKFILKKLDILVVRTGATYGKVLLFEDNEPAVFASYLIRLCFSKNKINHKFYWFFSRSKTYWNQVQSLVSGAGQPQFNANAIVKIKIPLPPLEEQKKIAVVLSQIQKNINIKDQLIKVTKELKKSIMKYLFTYGIKGEKIKHTENKTLFRSEKNSWRELKLGQIVDPSDPWAFTGGPFGSNLKVSDYTPEGVRIIQLQNIGDGVFHNDYNIFTSNKKADKLKSCNIYPGEIILSKMGNPVARACIVPNINTRYLMCSDGVRLNIDKSKYDIYFIYYQINSFEFRAKAESYSTGSTRKRISLSELKSIKLNIPSLIKQRKIADILQKIDEKIKNYEEQKASLQDLFKSMLHKLMTAQIRLHNIDITIPKGLE